MKKIIFGIIILLQSSLAAISQNPIGKIEEGKFIITSDLKEVKEDWNAVLKELNIQTELTEFEIITGVDKEDNDKTYYALLGRDEKKENKLATELILKDNELFYPDKDGYKKTVSCAGCSYACDPKKTNGTWSCTSGCGYDANSCKKTVTIQEYQQPIKIIKEELEF